MSIWKKAILWTKIKDSLAIGGLLVQGGMDIAKVSEEVKLYILAGNVLALLVGMWMEDKDRDGIVDIFQTEIKVKSETPVDIEVKKNIDGDK